MRIFCVPLFIGNITFYSWCRFELKRDRNIGIIDFKDALVVDY